MVSSLPAFVDSVPHYEVDKAGNMHISMGGMGLVMRVSTFLDGCEAGKAAIVDWQREQVGLGDNVVSFSPR